ncbi:MAG: hypothetical protein GY771_12390, partial [bacterium]|nr:hypothetical protein [bacterium]
MISHISLKVIIILAIVVFSAYADTEMVEPRYNTWTQTDWSGKSGLDIITDPNDV